MAYQGPRKCDCGCRRPAVLHLLAWDLSFATACVAKYMTAELQFMNTKLAKLELKEDETMSFSADLQALADAWDDGSPQTPPGFADWGQKVTDIADQLREKVGNWHREVRVANDVSSQTFSLPSGLRVVRLGWVARSPADDFPANAWVRVNGDSGNNYTYVRTVLDGSGIVSAPSESDNQATVGMSAGVVGGSAAQTESNWDGTLLVGGGRMRMTGTGFYRPGGNIRQVVSGGGYRVNTQTLTSLTFHVTGSGNRFNDALLYVEGFGIPSA